LPGERDNARENARCAQARKATHGLDGVSEQFLNGTSAHRRPFQCHTWMDNIKTWTGLSVEESIRMTEDRDKWRKYVHGVANLWIEDG